MKTLHRALQQEREKKFLGKEECSRIVPEEKVCKEKTKDDDKAKAVDLTKAGSNASMGTCRICQIYKSKENLISPCRCKGTLGQVHLTCLEKWLNTCGKQQCELCKFAFKATKKRRYSICQALRIWVRHPRHRNLIRSDLIVASILTAVTASLCTVCGFGMRYFVTESQKLGVPQLYTELVIFMFLLIIILGYLVTICLMAKDHFVPWYRWWTRTMLIKIIITLNDDKELRSDDNDMKHITKVTVV